LRRNSAAFGDDAVFHEFLLVLANEVEERMRSILSIFATAMTLALITSGCDVAGTAVRKTGKAAADTTRAASEVGETAAEGAADTVESTTRKAGNRMER